jgi:hypothetical protein
MTHHQQATKGVSSHQNKIPKEPRFCKYIETSTLLWHISDPIQIFHTPRLSLLQPFLRIGVNQHGRMFVETVDHFRWLS